MRIFLRLLKFLAPYRWLVALTIVLGCAMVASNMALLGMAAYVIAAAALGPLLVLLTLPIFIVRAMSVTRSTSRYAERLLSHSITFRLLAGLRAWVYSRLEPLAPAHLLTYRSGDMLTRLVSDVEELQNIYLRVISPIIVAMVIALLTFYIFSIFSPLLAWTALAFLVASGIGIPLLAALLSNRLGTQQLAVRSALNVQVVDGIEDHFRLETAQWLYALLMRAIETVISGPAVAIPLLRRFTAVYVEDGSTISLPDDLVKLWRGCRGGNGHHEGTTSAVKLTVRLDMLHGTVEGPLLQEGRRHESQSLLHHKPMAKGSLWIADLGYFALAKLVALSQAGVYFLMPYKDSVVLWYQGQRTDILSLLTPHEQEQEVEFAVTVGASKQVPCRLLARRLSEAEVSKRHEQQDEYARKHGTQVSERQRDLARWSLLISTVPAALMTLAQAWGLMRMRWQIE